MDTGVGVVEVDGWVSVLCWQGEAVGWCGGVFRVDTEYSNTG